MCVCVGLCVCGAMDVRLNVDCTSLEEVGTRVLYYISSSGSLTLSDHRARHTANCGLTWHQSAWLVDHVSSNIQACFALRCGISSTMLC